MQEEKEKKEKSYVGITKLALILRLCVVAYIIYLSITLLQGYMNGDGLPLYVLIIALTVFTGVGTVVTVITVRALIKGEYAGGKADIQYHADEEDVHGMKESDDSSDVAEETGSLSDRLKKYNEKCNNNDS